MLKVELKICETKVNWSNALALTEAPFQFKIEEIKILKISKEETRPTRAVCTS